MNKHEKNEMINELVETLTNNNVVYVADIANLTAEANNALRRNCHKNNVSLRVVKNTLLEKAIEKVEGKDFSELKGILAGPTSIMIAEVGNAPAKVIKEFRKKHDKPVLKGAYIDEAVFVGDDKVDSLAALKSKEEVIGDIILLLQSPAKNVVSSLQSGKNKISGLLKALEERAN
jgi:large subunit ribosomal protein L10